MRLLIRSCGRVSCRTFFEGSLGGSGLILVPPRSSEGEVGVDAAVGAGLDTHTVFRACLPRRGRKAVDDRLFLEALHLFSVENVRWRALPERFGLWNSVWKRFDRLSQAGVFEAFFDTLASMSDTARLVQMFDPTIVRAHVSAAGAKRGSTDKHAAAPAVASPRRSTPSPTPLATSSPST